MTPLYTAAEVHALSAAELLKYGEWLNQQAKRVDSMGAEERVLMRRAAQLYSKRVEQLRDIEKRKEARA